MRLLIFCCGFSVLAMGVSALKMLDPKFAFGFFQGAMTIGGAWIICGLFTIKMPWHGLIGAGIIALLGLARGLSNLPKVLAFFRGDRELGTLPIYETGVLLICLILFSRTFRVLWHERQRRLVSSIKNG